VRTLADVQRLAASLVEEQRITAAIEEPVVHTWTYKLDKAA
jgi:hypothetical protein